MDIAELAAAVVGAVAGIAGAFFAWVQVRDRLAKRRTAKPSPPEHTPGAPEEADYDVFVSYCHDDAALVTDLVNRLADRNIRVAYDKVVVTPGAIVFHEIDQAIRESRHGLLVISPSAMGSGPVMNEYYVLLRRSMQNGQLLIPVLVKDADLPEFIKIRFYSDLREVTDEVFDQRVDEIAEAIQRKL